MKKANLEQQSKQNLSDYRIGSSRRRPAPQVYTALIDIDLTRILGQLIKGYSLKAIFEWPEEIKDSESLNRLYLMVFHTLGELVSEHIKYSIPFDIQDERQRASLLREGLKDQFGEATIYRDLVQDFNKHDWNTEFDSVMADLFTALDMGWEWKDYRKGLVKRTKKDT